MTHGVDIGQQTEGAERADYIEILLEHRLRDASGRLNPDLERSEIFRYYRSQDGVDRRQTKLIWKGALSVVFPSYGKQIRKQSEALQHLTNISPRGSLLGNHRWNMRMCATQQRDWEGIRGDPILTF